MISQQIYEWMCESSEWVHWTVFGVFVFWFDSTVTEKEGEDILHLMHQSGAKVETNRDFRLRHHCNWHSQCFPV